MLTKKIPARLDTLHNIQQDIVAQLPLEFQEVCSKIELVLEEVLVNIFNHAYKDDDQEGEVEITFCIGKYEDQACAILGVRDWGTAFNPFNDVPPPNLGLDAEHRPIGGLGIHFVKTMVTHYVYKYEDDSNLIELYFVPSNFQITTKNMSENAC